jgi:beta-glucosidase-like glycosyl hydrolase
MPRERRVQAEAEWGQRPGARAGSGPMSPWLVVGIVFLAASLVAVGAIVAFSALGSGGSGGQGGAPTPTPARPTPGLFGVGNKQDGSGNSPAPGATPGAQSGNPPPLLTPAGAGGPLTNLAPPAVQGADTPPAATSGAGSDPGSSASPAATDAAPQTATSSDGAAQASPAPAANASPATAAASADPRVEQALAKLTTDEDRVGQMLLLGWIGNTAEAARPELQDLRAGGIVYVQNVSTANEASEINTGLKRIARDTGVTAPLITMDHEGGIVQRIKDVKDEGNNWDFAQTNPTDLQACQRGARHAQVLTTLGFNMNLAPDLDVNNNPNNPVIGKRSYSDDPDVVARLGAAYIQGLQGGGIAAVGKHFPGHGNTGVDSHLQLPILNQSVDDLEKIELVPFNRVVKPDVDIAAIMSAHIMFPALDSSGVPGTLSKAVMTGLLRNTVGFQGLAISDDLGAMKAITDNFSPGEAAVRAVNAGVDMLIMSSSLSQQRTARDALVAAVRSGQISRDRLDEAVRHVLTVKAKVGLLGGDPTLAGTACQ